MPNTTNLQLPFMDANQSQKYVTYNEALLALDVLMQIQVQSAALSAPPASPSDGQVWIAASGATGAWAGKDLDLAAWQDSVWTFYPPKAGWIAYNVATNSSLQWNGSAWSGMMLSTGGTLTGALTVDLNSGTLAAALAGTGIRLAAANGVVAREELDAYGAAAHFTGLRADGTAAAPTALAAADEIASLNAWGYAGATDGFSGPAAAVRLYAAQTWATGHHGTYLRLSTTPNNSTTLTDALSVENDGGIIVPPTVAGGSKGAGSVNATALYQAGVGLGSAAFVATGTSGATVPLLNAATFTGTVSLNGPTIVGAANVLALNAGQLTFFGTTSGQVTARVLSVVGGTFTQTLQGISDTFVYRTSPDTLTNKTLTTPIIGSFTVGTLPAAGTAGRVAYASNGRMFNGAGVLEGAGTGTGGLVVDNGSAWKIAGTNQTVQA